MKCPFCGSYNDQVIDSRPHEQSLSIRRRRECVECKKRFTTYERLEKKSLMVIKSDNKRELFDRQKLWNGITRACEKRFIHLDIIEKIVSEVEDELQDFNIEVSSKVIGEKVLEKLWKVDKVAYIRFASVYRQFADLDTFMQELKKLKDNHLEQRQ